MTAPETVEALLSRLSEKGIRITCVDGRLRLSGAESVLTQDITDAIRARKAEIIANLSLDVAYQDATHSETIPARHADTPPLSFAQQRLWFVEQMMPEAGLHHISLAVEAHGSIDVSALQAALQAVAERHAILRTRINMRDGMPSQRIIADSDIPLQLIDRQGDMPDEQEIDRIRQEEARRPFDLAFEPPLRLTVIRLGSERTLLLLTLHHIAGDGWSMDVLLGDLSMIYQAKVTGVELDLPALPIQYGDFAAWQRDYLAGPALERSLAFWTDHLEAPLPATQLPGDLTRPPVQANAGALHSIAFDAGTTARLKALAKAEGATLFATLFTAFNTLVYRYTGQRDLVIGTPVANRRHRETEGLIGLFVNPLPVRTRLHPAASFRETLRQSQATLWSVLDHQDLPFEQLVEALKPERDPSVHPLFQLKFQLDAQPSQRVGLSGLALTRLPRYDGVAKLDLSLNLIDAGSTIHGTFEYDTALFRPETITSLAAHFGVLIEAIAIEPDTALAILPLLGTEERQRQIVGWNATAKPFDEKAFFHTVFEAHAARKPDAIALVHVSDGKRRTLTYDALNRRANQIAHHLRGLGAGPETIVAIALERGFDMIAAWLGVLKSGAAYLPLDPAYPPERLAMMLSDSQARLVLTESRRTLPETVTRIDLDTDWPRDAATGNPDLVNRPDHLAYIIYTSGSTGRPKGVLVEHRGLVNLTQHKIRIGGVKPGDCVLQFFSFSFDASIPELVMALGAGASLLLLPASDLLPGPALAEHMKTQAVTHVTMTPSALIALPSGDYPALRMVLTGGEAPTPELIERWGTGRLFINAYGPTETTVNASMVPCGNGHPIEATLLPAANKQLYVLDANLEPVPVGQPGELHIGGLGIARGYHGRPALTAERFVPDPFSATGGVLYRTGDRACQRADGRIRVLGRLDDQVKIRGYRIEPGEIEAMVLTHPTIVAAAVVIHEIDGEKRVIAYGVAKEATTISAVDMKAFLAAHLPRYLVPDAFVWLDRLPLTVNGKIDTKALPLLDLTPQAGRPPQGETENAIAAIFAQVLGCPPVSATDDFFVIGGHSLLATRLSALAKSAFGLDIAIIDLFEAPTVEALAARISNRNHSLMTEEEMCRADTELDATIRIPTRIVSTHPLNHVFLTGATGFLGAYLLSELLKDKSRTVSCLVRGMSGADRLRQSLQSYGLWRDDLLARIRPLPGDLSQQKFGLSGAVYTALGESVDAIIHNGAEVHHLHPYQRLRAPNVGGTVEAIRLAAVGRGRPLHLISSLSALTRRGAGETITESAVIGDFPLPAGGYNQTKWVAEHLAQAAKERGLPVTIYRPGAISGDSRTGTFNKADILCRLMQGYLRSGLAPEGDTPLEMLPVDTVAHAIIALADEPSSIGQTFHLVHSSPVSSALLFEAAAAEGLYLQRIPRLEWRAELDRIAREETDHPLYPLMGLFEQKPASSSQGTIRTVERRETHRALAAVSIVEPALDLRLFRSYLRAFILSGALNPSKENEQRYA
ncbi:amino acid adenylation domain-containing protein [Agrobacterium vitis]|uniref:non-ribosomal peptide synthetase n=1 Tax=Rhizobium/Agrobacterium group TaxID=227290 RepID=UPI0012E78DB9|nr:MULTISPECIES: non-ribosomal peptide synthetase [Rhizobium/Agrobacterium group]MCF1493640.1 amino acid adenylation domain-containing protein [Allorhizobium ampelinum]MVA47025.1 amino acid adenylation domain-containing protein [Agrobacterium vitis]